MKTKLITALRTSAKALENDTFDYEWNEPCKCNAGIVVCALTGKSSNELRRFTNQKEVTLWTEFVGENCPITGIPKNKLLRELYGYGLTAEDVVHLENLSNPRVLARMNLGMGKAIIRSWLRRKEVQVPVECEYNNKAHLIEYLRAWADLLTEEGVLDVPERQANDLENPKSQKSLLVVL